MALVSEKHFPQWKFSLYFLASVVEGGEEAPKEGIAKDSDEAFEAMKGRYGPVLELTHNHGTEDDENFSYHNGNTEPKVLFYSIFFSPLSFFFLHFFFHFPPSQLTPPTTTRASDMSVSSSTTSNKPVTSLKKRESPLSKSLMLGKLKILLLFKILMVIGWRLSPGALMGVLPRNNNNKKLGSFFKN